MTAVISKQLMAEQFDSVIDASDAAKPPKTSFLVATGVALFALAQGIAGEQATASTDVEPNTRTITAIQE